MSLYSIQTKIMTVSLLIAVGTAVASLIMSLESVFAALSGWLLLGQGMTGREAVGCALVFAAVVLAQIPFAALRGRSAAKKRA
mgnify:CR=1 FL=1